VFTHKSQSAHACDLNFILKGEGLFKVTGSHVHWKSGNILETVLDTERKWYLYTTFLIAVTVMTLIVLEGSVSLFKCDISYLWCSAQSLYICRASYVSLLLHYVRLLSHILKINAFIFFNANLGHACLQLSCTWYLIPRPEKCNICCILYGYCRLCEYSISFHCASSSMLPLPTYPFNGRFLGGLVTWVAWWRSG